MGRLKHIIHINIILGAWLVIAPFVTGYSMSTVELANDVGPGALLIGCSWWLLAASTGQVEVSMLQLLGGLWVIAAPFLLHYEQISRASAKDVGVGRNSVRSGQCDGNVDVCLESEKRSSTFPRVRRPMKRGCAMKSVMFVSNVLAAMLVGTFAVPAQADECDKLTYVTFSVPVALPGVNLPPGTYRFTRPDCLLSNHVLRVSSQDGTKVYATLLTIPADRPEPSNQATVVFAETPTGAPEPIKAWFYPGETTGDELVYRKVEARGIADARDRTV